MSSTSPDPMNIVLPDALLTAIAGLGPWGLVAAIVLKVGLPFASKLVYNIEHNVPVTMAEWDALKAKAALSYDDLPGGAITVSAWPEPIRWRR